VEPCKPYTTNTIPIIPQGTNAVDAAQHARMHAEFRCIYTNIINVYQALKQIILEAYDNMYTSQLEDYLLQYANHSSLEILMHLKQTYGFINPAQLAENYNKMTAPINCALCQCRHATLHGSTICQHCLPTHFEHRRHT
jgi:hypothetical protein